MAEISCMLLHEIDYAPSCFEKYASWIKQTKENGIRALVHIKDNQIVGIRNRSNAPVLFMFPEFKNLPVSIEEGILDCEIVVFKDGRSTYYGGIDQRRSVPTPKVLAEFPATIVVFDAIKVNGTTLLMKPYKARYEMIVNNLRENDKLKIIKNYPDVDELWKIVLERNLEGLVLKNPDATYEMGKRSQSYIKCKNYKWCDVLVEKTETNTTGTKIFGKTNINEEIILVEAQVQSQTVLTGDTQKIRYLDTYQGKLIQPTHHEA